MELMFDLETMSTNPDAAIVSIGACKWDSEGIHDTFYAAISLADSLRYGLHKDPDTVAWWKKQPIEATLAWAQDGKPLKQALQEFVEWLGPDAKDHTYYCWGLNFDVPILATSLERVGIEKPWKYWNLRCARTIHAVFDTGKIAKREGVYHNAKDDAVTQATELIRILNAG